MATSTGAELLARGLAEAGVERIYGVPGEQTLALTDALSAAGVEVVVTRHEQVAAFLAATEGRLTGRPGVCFSTLGPGATNLITGVAHAHLGRWPMIAISAQRPLEGDPEGDFQYLPLTALFAPVTKRSRLIRRASSVPAELAAAWTLAMEGRPGPVHLVLPQDVARARTDAQPVRPESPARPHPSPRAIDAALAAIGARRAVVLASSGAQAASAALLRFVEATEIPCVTTQLGKGAIPESHPRALGCLGAHSPGRHAELLRWAEVTLTVGYDAIEFPPEAWNPCAGKAVVHLDESAPDAREGYVPGVAVVGALDATLDALASRLPARRTGAHAPPDVPERPRDDSLDEVVAAVRDAMGDEDVVSLDNGLYKLWFASGYETRARNTLLLDDALASMGAGLAGAMAAKRVYPERRALAVCGDGGFLMNVQDLETAVRLGLDLHVLVLADGGYGMIEWKQAKDGYARDAVRFGNPDFVKLAEAFGARGVAVDGPAELADALREPPEGVVLVCCPIDYGIERGDVPEP